MTGIDADRRIADDWYDGVVPGNVTVHPDALVESSYSFHGFRSRQPCGAAFGRGSSMYLGTMLDVGVEGCVTVGDFAILNGPRIICDSRIVIGDYALIAWRVVVMDTYRLPLDAERRQRLIRAGPDGGSRVPAGEATARPVNIGRNVWIGFDSCVLPGVSIGEGSIVGARSTVTCDVPPFTIVAGNPARVIRSNLENPGRVA
jgi:acetyltransferase-like isoleucine patch superfamily enzyme